MDGSAEVKTRRTAPKEVRRQQRIDATISAIAEKGISGTTMAEVTGRAGLSLGIVSLHFENKDNLLKSPLKHLAQELRDKWGLVQDNPDLGPAEKLWGILEANFHPDICTFDKVRVWFAFFGEAQYRAFYREMVDEFDTERAVAIETLLKELADADGRSDFDAFGTTQTIESLADGLWLGMMLYPEWMPLDDAKARLWALLSEHFPTRFAPGALPKMASAQ